MYCPSCGNPVKVNSDKCTCCGLEINKKLFELEPEKTEADIQKNDIFENNKYGTILEIIKKDELLFSRDIIDIKVKIKK